MCTTQHIEFCQNTLFILIFYVLKLFFLVLKYFQSWTCLVVAVSPSNTTLSLPEPTYLLYYGALKIKEAKLKDVSDLASKYVPAECLWYYKDLKSNEDQENIDYSDIE